MRNHGLNGYDNEENKNYFSDDDDDDDDSDECINEDD